MRERESIQNPLDNPLYAEQQIEAGIRNVLGNNVAFHHTVLRRDLGMTYGGLHENRGRAVAAKQKLVDEAKGSAWEGTKRIDGRKVGFSQAQADASAAKWESQADVVELSNGQEYSPWGTRYYTYTHGVDDGTHGSKNKG
jgi:hypothetical protein